MGVAKAREAKAGSSGVEKEANVGIVNSEEPETLETWAILEIMGHVKLAGKISEEVHFGVTLCRIDVPAYNGQPEYTRFFGGTSIYSLLPCSEEVARATLRYCQPAPVSVLDPKPTRQRLEFGRGCRRCGEEPCQC